MTFEIEKLELEKSYTFDVIAQDGKNNFAAKLALSPTILTLTIMGEKYGDRDFSSECRNPEHLICKSQNRTFILIGLRYVSFRTITIPDQNKDIRFFEYVFEVDHVIFSPTNLYENNSILSISIHSDAIEKWIGNTETQEEIIRSYHSKEPGFYSPPEFVQKLNDLGKICVEYNLPIHSSSSDFSSGINFPPTLSLRLDYSIHFNQLNKIYSNIYSLMAFFIGNDFSVELVRIGFESGQEGTFYYLSEKKSPKYDQSYALFPLGKNLRFDFESLPSLPLSTFNSYMSLPESQIGYFKKYLRYRRMENPEERFLGFFRILESLCLKKKNFLDEELLEDLITRVKPCLIKRFDDKKNVTSFLKGIPRLNSSKYNTEKCIQDFYSKIPSRIVENWKLKKSDIGAICKLRNDITHANDYYASEFEIEEKSKFIEILLVLALFEKIDVPLTLSSQVIHRIDGYDIVATTNNVA
jgi:hypothetical protein